MKTGQPQTLEITEDVVKALLIRLFIALQAAFSVENEPGTIWAYELIEMLVETAEKDPDVFRTVLTEENLAAFTRLQKKAQTGSVGITDLFSSFPGIANAMKGGGLGKIFK